MNHSSRIHLLAGILLFLCGLALPLAAQSSGGFTFTSDGTAVTITGYTGAGGAVVIPATINGLPVRTIGFAAFFYQTSLTGVTIPDSVTSIQDAAFGSCVALSNISVTGGNAAYLSVSGVLFDKSISTLVQCPAGKGGNYVVPDGVTSIRPYAFKGCRALTSVTITNSVTEIGGQAFSECTSLSGISIPSSVIHIGGGPFGGCSGLLNIEVASGNTAYESSNGVIFNRGQTTLIQYPTGRAGSYAIPGSVTVIGYDAFLGSTVLTGVTIPNSVTTIVQGAFFNCSGLTSITIPNSVTVIGWHAFQGCSGLASVTIPASVNSIGGQAFFGCSKLTGVIFQGNAPSMDVNVFQYTAPGFTLYFQPGSGGFTTPTWQGYPTSLVTKSNDANLSALTLSRGGLVPAFSPSFLGYSASVSHGTALMTVTPVIAHPLATGRVRVNGVALIPVGSGETSPELPLNVGGNIIEIIVTAEDGTARTTFVIVTRAPEFTETTGWPLAATGAPANVTTTSAILVGAVDPQLFATSVRFEYGSTPLLGTTTPAVTLPAGAGVKDVAMPITGLIPAGTYHYRIIATNDAGEALGDIVTFPAIPILGRTTPSAAPLVVTGSASAITPNSATIGGIVNAYGGTTLVHIEYGRDSVQESKTLAIGVGNPETPAQVALALEGLLSGTTYRYRLVAVNSLGTSFGAENSFTTAVSLPGVATGNAASLGTTSAMVEGTVDAKGTETRIYFDYGPTGGEFPLSVAAEPFVISSTGVTQVATTMHNLSESATYQYRVRAVNPGGTATGEVREFSVDALSGLLQVMPAPVPLADRMGFALVLLDPPGIGSGWRFAGETTWRQPGIPAGGLVTGDRLVEFRPVAGYVAPDAEPVLITSGGAATVISHSYVATATPGSSNLRVILKPDALAAPSVPIESRAQWRLMGNTQWRDSGTVASGLPAGSHLIECKPVNGRTAPQPTMVTVADGGSGSVTLTYFPAELSSAASPALDPYDLSSADPAAAFTGQLRGGGASGSGFAVGRRVVATAAHVVWDEGTLSAVPDLKWHFQRDAGSHEPVPLLPRGFHILTGYAVQRGLENSPGTATPPSQVRDVAALYFPEDVARGGYSGFLASDLPTNEYLVSSASKRLVGYPVEDIAASSLGRLHATPSITQALVSAAGRTYTSTFLRGRGGMSGGPLSVFHENRGTWFPAAIYLGGSNQMVVRAIDGEVVELFRMAERSASGGGNDTGGGITHSSVTAFDTTSQPGAIRVTIEPAAALGAGARWGLDAGNATRLSGDQLGSLSSENHVLHFKTVPGFLPPTPQTLNIRGGQLLAVTFAYEPVRSPLESWRWRHFNAAKVQADSQDSADPDGDGQTNLQEFSAGTDPNNGADLFKVLSATRNGSTFTLQVHGWEGRTYALERRDGLAIGNWQRVPGAGVGPLAREDIVTLSDAQAPPERAFYRVVVSQP